MPALRTVEVASRKRMYAVGPDSAFEFLEFGIPLGIAQWDDDFQGDTLHGGYQSTASGVASVAAAISAGLVNGQIVLDPGTADAGRSDLSLGLHYRGDQFAVIAARFRTGDGLTSSKFEIGFTDVISGTDAGAVNVKATPSFNADDCAVLVYDTNDDTLLTLVGRKATVAATVYDFTTVLANNTFYYGVVALRDDRAAGYLLDANGNVIERQPASGYMEAAVTATVLLTPWIFAQNRSASQRRFFVDRLKVYQLATATS